MLARIQWRRAGAMATLALLFMVACRDSVTDRATGLTPGGPSFAAGGSISVNLDQCANNIPRGGDCTWQNGDLNGNNSQYAEGLAVPFRLTIDGLTPGTQYQIHLNYDWTAGGHKAYDFLASDNATEQVNVCAAGGGGVPTICSSLGSPVQQDFPGDDFPPQFQPGLSVTGATVFAASALGGGFVANDERKLKLYGGSIDLITQPTHTTSNGTLISSASSLTGNTVADMLVTFTPTGSSVLLTWSAHLAQSAYWDGAGTPTGADQISGAPWHMRTQGLQTSGGTSAGNKNQDRSIQPSAIIQPPVMDLSKTADAATVNAGSPIGFTITVHNTGAGAADGSSLTDQLPTGSGISWTIASQSGPVTCTITNTLLSCPTSGTASFPAGGTLAVHITSPTTFASCATYTNTATVGLMNGVAPAQVTAQTIVQCPSLSITKTADAATVNAGSAIGFVITVSNPGQGAAAGFALSDPLPTGSGVSWSIASQSGSVACAISSSTLNCPSTGTTSLAAGGSFTVHVTSPTTSASCKAYSNTATASASNHASVQASASTTVNCPSLTLTKTADAATVNAGSPIGFTVTVANAGSGTATGFALSDPLPTGSGISWTIDSQSGPVSCSIVSNALKCPASGSADFTPGTLTVHIASNTTSASCGVYSNTATVSFGNGTAPAPATAQTTVQCPSLQATKTADAATVNAGSPIGSTITVSNSGQGAATGFTLSDPLPTGTGISWSIASQTGPVTCAIANNTLSCPSSSTATLAGGATITVHVTSNTTSASCGVYANTATVSLTNGTAPDPATAQTTVLCPNLSLTKTADAATVNAGGTIGFTVTVHNTGQGDATGFVLSDPLPTGTNIVWSIASQSGRITCSISSNALRCPTSGTGTFTAGGTLTVHVTSPTAFASCGTYSNTATVSLTNGSAPSPATAQTTVQCPSLHITKTADAASVSAGTAIGFTITVTNTGAGAATGFTLSDPLPTGSGISWSIASQSESVTCAIASNTLNCPTSGNTTFDAGGSITVHVTSNTGFASCATYNNTATAQAANHATVTANAGTTVQCPNLTITKTPDPGGSGYTLHPGGTATFAITVSNTGAGSATNVAITDTLPLAPTPPWQGDQASCTVSSITATDGLTHDLLSCNVGTLAAGGSFTVHVSSVIPANYLFQGPSPSGTPIEIDGNLTDDAAAGGDWASLGISCTAPIFGCDLDKPTGSTDNSFGQGTKEDTPVPSVVLGSIPNNKSDLLRFYVDTARFGTTDYLYLAWERVQAPKGTTNMDFELNQSSTLSSNGVTPVRTAGDLLIKYDLSSGGTNPVLGYHKWVTAASAGGLSASAACEASNSFPCWGKVTSLVGSATVAAAINTGSVTDPIDPNAPRSLDPLTFGEARIDLEGSGIFQTGVCVNFGSTYLKSRSSDSFTAEVKDFIAPIPVSVSNCQNKFLDNRAWAKGSNTGSAISDTGEIEVTQSQSASALTGAQMTRLAINSQAVDVPVGTDAGGKHLLTLAKAATHLGRGFAHRAASRQDAKRSDFVT